MLNAVEEGPMVIAIAEPRGMAKKMGRPKGDRDDVSVRLDRALAKMAKAITTANGGSVAEYLSDMVGPTIRQDYVKLLRESDLESKPKKS
jgi:hypothetical protein